MITQGSFGAAPVRQESESTIDQLEGTRGGASREGVRRRLLVFGINYAPEETGIAVHTAGLARALPEFGWDVTVVTGIPHYPAWRPMPVPRQTFDGAVQVIRRLHYVPRHQSLVKRAMYEASWLTSCIPLIWRQRRPDLVLGIVPSLSGGLLAASAAQWHRVPYVVMFQDLLGRAAKQSQFQGMSAVGGVLQRTEVGMARRAAAIVVVADGFRRYLIGGGVAPDRIVHVRNPVRAGPPNEGRRCVRSRLGWSEAAFVVLHSGNMGYKQALGNVIRAADWARGERAIRFVLQGDGSQRAWLEEMARHVNLPNLTFLPLAPPEDVSSILAAADLLLINQSSGVRDMSLPSKMTAYFAAGVAVVAAVAADSETARELNVAGAGVVVRPDDPSALVAAIKDLAVDATLRRRLGVAGQQYASTCLRAADTSSQLSRVLDLAVSPRRHVADG